MKQVLMTALIALGTIWVVNNVPQIGSLVGKR
jgi:hypothetical protein